MQRDILKYFKYFDYLLVYIDKNFNLYFSYFSGFSILIKIMIFQYFKIYY